MCKSRKSLNEQHSVGREHLARRSSCSGTQELAVAHRKKPGPKTQWQRRVRYNRARCIERLKPSQIVNLTTADVFAGRLGTPLNGFLTIKLSERSHPLSEFHAAAKRLSQWYRQWGGELRWIYVWEAIGGHHLHALLHVPHSSWQLAGNAIASAFTGHDTLLKRRRAGPSMMAYLLKGTDMVTHWQLRGNSTVKARHQGKIIWKRCGTTANIGQAARQNVKTNCAQSCTAHSHIRKRVRTVADGDNHSAGHFATYVVPKSTHSPLEATCGAAHMTQAPAPTPDRIISTTMDPCISTGHEKTE